MATATGVTGPPAAPPTLPPGRPNRALALLRNSWRQLTSMRTALVLLFLLAVAAIPGSLLPQRGVNIEQVNDWQAAHPKLFPVLNSVGAFEVFASPWFSAVYVLLFVSLVGCIVPRARDHLRALRGAPPAGPRRLDRLPQHRVRTDPAATDPAAIAAVLRRRRWRVAVRGDTVAAEKGYLKETGNLVFHLSLIAVLLGVALGNWYGWHGNRMLVAGPDRTFCNGLQQYDESGLGPRLDASDLPSFCLELTDFQATYQQSGQPRSFRASVRVQEPGRASRLTDFSVNDPLRLHHANVYLLGHGYAPVIRYTDRYGRTQTTVAPFLTEDGLLTGQGVATFPDVDLDPETGTRDPDQQVAFDGLYLPTAPDSAPYIRSEFPAERNPLLNVVAYRGNLGLDAGIPGSVYRLDQRQISAGKLKQVGTKVMRPGDTWTLDDGSRMEFLGTRPYVTLAVRYDPGEKIVLGGAVALLVGLMLSLTGRRRRVWFRVVGAPTEGSTTDGSSLVEAGGLPRTDYSGFADEFDQLVTAVTGDRKREGTD
ncbi:cytochrome c biogenesis protein ResB [Plantactinospora sp. KBS50]|uniref:cytochrome c biogenesis protein ResB n=1 Tax=Plantactinospora sp. KBS50 TaxID=2024580 RepID=UPI000BAAD720|nr:cytochrome c biogenesis protein ResB [Plantactinospora sp. KBS50]ASW53181.1 cytochrome C biogenesis protein ResB [Plantactinospora sp. KBS50]